MKTVGIRGIGMYVPEQKLTNDDLEKMVETSDEWIVSRTGISERRIAGKDLKTSDMALRAARMAMERAELAVDECAFVISSTASHEVTCPAQAARVAGGLGLTNSYCFDINAACSGLVFALALIPTLWPVYSGAPLYFSSPQTVMEERQTLQRILRGLASKFGITSVAID